MRILEVNKFFHERRGAERHFLDVIEALSAEGHEVAVFSMDHPKNLPSRYPTYLVSRAGFAEGDAGNSWHVLKGIGRLFWSFETRRLMRKALDEFRPDIVHVHNAYHQLSPSFLPIIRKRGIPVILTVHDYHIVSPDKDSYHESVGSSYWKFLFVRKYPFAKRVLLVLRAYWDRIAGFYSKNVDRYIAPSVFVKETLKCAGVPEEKIQIIPHFIADESASEKAISVDDAGKEPYALYVGSVSGEKGIADLVTLFDSIGYPLVLAGRKTMDIPKSVSARYVGERTKEEISGLYAGASFVVSASRLPETFGLVALEANTAGKPFFGYATGALSEIVEQGKTGWLAEDENDLAAFLRRYIADHGTIDDAETIRCKTLERFGREKYLEALVGLAENLQKGKR
ncbi:MAG: glycosyltransferase [Candidatus Moraniibacteriota bacterium]